MKLLVFSESDLPITKGLRRLAEVVTAWPMASGPCDVPYDPERAYLNEIFTRLPPGFRPDAVVLTNLDYVTFLWGLRESDVPVVAMITDSNLCFDVFQNALPFVDLFVCNEEQQADRLRSLGAETEYLPWFGMDPELFHPRSGKPRWDVVFAGNLNPFIHRERGRLLETLLRVPERFETRVLTGIRGRAYASALANARIVFNYSIRSEVNRRVYEALGVGRLLLVESSNAEVLRYFGDRQHLATYSESNLIDTVEHFVQKPDEREAIARAGYEEALARHTGFHKAQALLGILERRGRSKGLSANVEPDSLRRAAARVFLRHGRIDSAIRLSQESLALSDRAENRSEHARVLGTAAFLNGGARSDLVESFQRATEQALAATPRGGWIRWNHMELGHSLGKLAPEAVRGFLSDFQNGQFDLEDSGGPLPVAFDAFRVAWEAVAGGDFESEGERKDAERRVLLARVYEVLGDEERRVGRTHAAIEAYLESLKHREDGYVEHRLGLAQAGMGRSDEAMATIERAVAREPFFFGARRDLAALQLNRRAEPEARAAAEDALRTIVRPFQSFEPAFVEILDHTSHPETILAYEIGRPVLWEGVVFNTSGYARETSLIVDELLRRGIPLGLRPGDLKGQPSALDPEVRQRLVDASKKQVSGGFIQVAHGFPDALGKLPGAIATVCRTTYEMDRVPLSWKEPLCACDQVWVTSQFTRETFERAGIPADRLRVIPNPVGEYPLVGPEPVEVLERAAFNFLSVFEWNPRKGWDVLLEAYLREFARGEDVALVLRVYSIAGTSQAEIRDEMRCFIRNRLGMDPDSTAKVLFVDETLSHGEMRSLFTGAQAFVLPSRGEGFGRPYLEALVAGLPTIGTAWGGQTDFLTEETGYLIDVECLEPVPEHVAQYHGCRWARPSVDHLRALLRRVYEDPEEGRRKARRTAGSLLSRFNVQRVANLVVEELNRFKE